MLLDKYEGLGKLSFQTCRGIFDLKIEECSTVAGRVGDDTNSYLVNGFI